MGHLLMTMGLKLTLLILGRDSLDRMSQLAILRY